MLTRSNIKSIPMYLETPIIQTHDCNLFSSISPSAAASAISKCPFLKDQTTAAAALKETSVDAYSDTISITERESAACPALSRRGGLQVPSAAQWTVTSVYVCLFFCHER